jgi:DNA-binding transcriptional regulator PaaX
LRNILQLLGFGKIQDSCWASPYDYSDFVYNLCKRRSILNYVCLYEGSFFAGKDMNILIDEAWKMEEIKDNYLEVFDNCKQLLERINTKNIEKKSLRDNYVKIFNLFKQTTGRDHFLPEQFLIDWPLKKTEVMLRQLASEIFKINNLPKMLL